MKLTIRAVDLHRIDLKTRMPFKYGIATMTHVPLVFVSVQLEANAKMFRGISSDLLPPKWFTKDPRQPVEAEIDEMAAVIEHASRLAEGLSGENPFQIWRELYQAQSRWARQRGLPPLLAHFGTSLVERALIEAGCKASGKTFSEALRSGGLGVDLGQIHQALRGFQPAEFLPPPLDRITARHTVGLADPLTDAGIAPVDKLDDGLPQSLESCIRHYGLRHFKIKVQGRIEEDLDRLRQTADVLRAHAPPDYAFTLDGNEQFKEPETFRSYWRELEEAEDLRPFFKHLLFVEQPLHRDVALDDGLAATFARWPQRPPIIIDESDGELDSLPRALALGYAGTSHKNCKGVFKGIANRCLLLHLARREPGRKLLMSGEDLANIGPVAVIQDLCVMAALGIHSVERNGHYYFRGLSMFPPGVQRAVLEHHPDLYLRTKEGWPALRVEDGEVRIDSLNRAPFGTGFEVALDELSQKE
jgi:hypothetical protein